MASIWLGTLKNVSLGNFGISYWILLIDIAFVIFPALGVCFSGYDAS